MSQIKLKHSGGNGVIIAAPSSNPAADRTITLPSTANGTLLTTTNPKSGNIIQVVSVAKTDSYSESVSSGSNSNTVSGLAPSITPTSSSNKILVMLTLSVGSTGGGCVISLYRDSTKIGIGDAAGNRYRASTAASDLNVHQIGSVGFTFLDEPADTNSHTYTIKLRAISGSSQTLHINSDSGGTDSNQRARGASTITLMEVAA